jgi:flagellar basal-body rod modification protein FlgD
LEIESNTNVVELPVSRQLLANLMVSTPVITPNGDGRNDALTAAVDLVNVLERRSLRLRILDLSGRPLREIESGALAGHYELSWDGRDGGGELVPPGLYLIEFHIDGDAGAAEVRRVVSVVY